ncbi:MAG: type II secretion system minor pseudopilin GspK [Nitrospirae bacterium]|nr:type II secretion system minor pseudopilin GspK [Nitrospirota bacterium]
MKKKPSLNESGIALVLTLVITALITAMVIEFAHGVYVSTNLLHNWQTAQRLSLISSSGLDVSTDLLNNYMGMSSYTYPKTMAIPVEMPLKDFRGEIILKIEDENSKFNLNSLIYPNGLLNKDGYDSFKRLLTVLEIDVSLADRIADWIDPDKEPRITGAEKSSKNGYLDSIDELLLFSGLDKTDYNKLARQVTVYGDRLVNINTADIPVLMSLSASVDRETAQRITRQRDISPFLAASDILKVSGLERSGIALMGLLTVKGSAFLITSTAEAEGVTTIIESVIDARDRRIKYWREM